MSEWGSAADHEGSARDGSEWDASTAVLEDETLGELAEIACELHERDPADVAQLVSVARWMAERACRKATD